MTKPTKRHVRRAKSQINLGIRPVWSESSLSAWRKLGSLSTHWAHSEDSDQTGRMPRLNPPSLIRVFAGRICHFVCFVMRRLICFFVIFISKIPFSTCGTVLKVPIFSKGPLPKPPIFKLSVTHIHHFHVWVPPPPQAVKHSFLPSPFLGGIINAPWWARIRASPGGVWIGWARKWRNLVILYYGAPINGKFGCVYNWQNISKHVYSVAPV